MNYRDPQLQARLAADYVSGVMKGRARRRFEQLMVADANLRREVSQWEERLLPLSLSLPPQEPPARVWRSVRRHVRALNPRAEWGWRGLAFWRALAGGLAVALLALVIVYPGQIQRAAEARYLAVLQDGQAQAAIVLSAARDGRLTLRTVADLRGVAGARTLELWALPAGGTPRSLGLVSPIGVTSLHLTPDDLNADMLAISLEPPGGSPSGSPTGPVTYSGRLLAM